MVKAVVTRGGGVGWGYHAALNQSSTDAEIYLNRRKIYKRKIKT